MGSAPSSIRENVGEWQKTWSERLLPGFTPQYLSFGGGDSKDLGIHIPVNIAPGRITLLGQQPACAGRVGLSMPRPLNARSVFHQRRKSDAICPSSPDHKAFGERCPD